jgi:FkbM family methyltransferase
MPANSLGRRIIKKVLHPVLNEGSYRYFQAFAMAWDIRARNWSEPELDLLSYAILEGETALDIGANYGLYSYHLSRSIGPKGQVYAFEPVPFTYDTLRLVAKILRFPKNVHLIPKGCGDRTGKINFTVPVQGSGAQASGLAYISGRNEDHPGKETQVRWDATKEVSGEIVTLDSFLPDVSNVSLIKCDIEGAEILAFRGGKKLIAQHLPTVICEINPWYLEGFGLSLNDLTSFFFDMGYELFSYDHSNSRKLVEITSLSDVVEDNYLFIHPTRQNRFAALLQRNNVPKVEHAAN